MDKSSFAKGVGLGAAAVTGAAAAGAGLLLAQGKHAKRTIGVRNTSPPFADTRYGGNTGTSMRLVMIGDSLATGLGADDPRDTIGAQLAGLVAEYGGKPVLLNTVAEVGARSRDLARQVQRAMHYRPHVAVIIIGANDVTHMVSPARATALLAAQVRRLRVADVQVVVGTAPDLGTIQPIQPPLRWVARRWARAMAMAQSVAVVEAGGRSVALADILGPEFEASPRVMFAADQFHPSREGYEATAQALAPAVLAAVARGAVGEILPEPYEPSQVTTLQDAAAIAAETPGMEVDGVAMDKPGLWARLLRRRLPEEPMADDQVLLLPSESDQGDETQHFQVKPDEGDQ